MKAFFNGKKVEVAPINDDFEIVEDSELYIDLNDNTKSYSIQDLQFID